MITEEMIKRINMCLKYKYYDIMVKEPKLFEFLRAEYIKAFRENLKAQLDNIEFVDSPNENN